MSQHLCFSIHYLLPISHGRGEDGEPEWPPSPLRLFQALTAAAAGFWNEREQILTAAPALEWLESQPQPLIIAAPARPATYPYRTYVPDNSSDLVAKSWSRGDTTKTVKRTEKDIRPCFLGDGQAVHFLYSAPTNAQHLTLLTQAARSITHLGWGIDTVVANSVLMTDQEVEDKLKGERWLPCATNAGQTLRIPIPRTLDNLGRKHRAFLNRIGRDERGNDSFRPVPPLTAFSTVHYQNQQQPTTLPVAAFRLLKNDGSGMRAFAAEQSTSYLAERLRAATASAAEEQRWQPDEITKLILGHGENRGETHQSVGQQRLAFLPLPSVEYRNGQFAGIRAIRRIMVTSFDTTLAPKVRWAKRSLSGTALQQGDRDLAWLEPLDEQNKQVEHYLKPASTWSTVTPVILAGLNQRGGKIGPDGRRQFTGQQKEKQRQKTIRLILKSLLEAGYDPKLAELAEIEVSHVGFLPGVSLASQYQVRERLNGFPRVHVQIHWRDQAGTPLSMPGPICIGRGRFFGLGLFVGLPTANG